MIINKDTVPINIFQGFAGVLLAVNYREVHMNPVNYL